MVSLRCPELFEGSNHEKCSPDCTSFDRLRMAASKDFRRGDLAILAACMRVERVWEYNRTLCVIRNASR